MISLTRLSGSTFLLNADLIERVDATPDTVVTLVDGTKYVVSEALSVVLGEIVDYRARIVARAPLFEELEADRPGFRTPRTPEQVREQAREHRPLPPHLSPVPDAGDRRRGGTS